MNWYEQLRGYAGHQNKTPAWGTGVASIQSAGEIPIDAVPHVLYRLAVEVVRITERVTRAGSPCWFLSCRDAEGLTLDVVVWETQMARFQGRLVEGASMILTVRPPKEGYSAFTLV